MALPLVFNNQIIGVLGVANHLRRDNFNHDDQRLLNAIGSQIDTAIFESLERRHLRRVLGRSVDPRIMERLLAESNDGFLKGERAVLTVLYADLRGSTHLAETIAPELLVEFINDYLGQMTRIILAHEGTLDKFVGDQVMALFGAPYPQPDHALRAVRVGLAMQKGHQALLETWRSYGIKDVPIGIGLATGELIVGEMGSSQRTDYTVIGRAANLGARICNIAKGGQVLISQQTYDLTRDHLKVNPISGLRFKGVTGEVTVYEVLACDE
jgi:adenylate cyclase